MTEALDLVRAAREATRDRSRPDVVDRARSKGKLTARERVDALVDPGSFSQIGQLTRLPESTYADVPGADSVDRNSFGDGIIGGVARIDGRSVMLFAQDAGTFGGTSGLLGARIKERVAELAQRRGLPLVMILDGGGHRIQDGLSSRSFPDAGPMMRTLVRMSGWVPIVALILGDGFAGNSNYAALADHVIMVDGVSTMGIAGPALVEAAIGERVAKDDLGGTDVQVDRNGIAHLAVESEEAAFEATRKWLAYLPSNADAAVPIVKADDSADRRDSRLAELVPSNPRQPYDVKDVLLGVVDEGSMLEVQPTHARNVVVAFGRLDGRAVGLVANQPMFLAGTLDADACEKTARFISLCDAYGLPLVFFIDVPGFMVGSQAESSKLARRSARILFELGRASVPRISVVLRKGYGLGFVAMGGGRAFEADLALAWPTAEICAMSIEGAVDVAFRREYESAADPASARRDLVELFRSRVGPLEAASGFGVDDVIDPRDTRPVLIGALRDLPSRHGSGLARRQRGISPI